jgi:hypothetical protein
MSDQNPEVPGLPDPAEAAEAASEAADAVQSAPEAVTEVIENAPERVTEVVEAAPTYVDDAAGAVPPPPPAFDAGAVPPPPPGYGAPSAAMVPVFPNGKPMLDAAGNPVSDKSRLAAALLCWFVGVLGVHRFYVGKVGTGVAMLLTCGGLGIWALIDLVIILVGSFRDQDGRALENW